jgi:small subunit ribosomal protein S1
MSPRPVNPSHGDEEMQTPERLEFEKLLQQYDYAFKRGEIVRGTIIALESSGALVDIGAKTAAFLPNKEVATPYSSAQSTLKPGEEYEFYILFEEDEDGQLTLSLRRVQTAQNWQKLEELMAADAVVQCKVTAVVKGGLLVDVLGLRGFIPSSHLRVKQTLEDLVGKELPAKIINLDRQRNNIILSHRKMIAEQMAEQRKDLFSRLHEGAIVEGEVVRLTDFGAFVDLGGVDGLLPLSQMSWRWVEHPSDILSIGDTIQVEVIGIDHEKQRVSLSIKGQHADPWNEVTKQLALGDEVEGTVTRMKHFGAFVEVYPGVEALLPSKDITDYEHRNGTKIDVGQTIKTYIVKFSPDERRISLSFHPLSEEEKQRFRDRQAAASAE